MNGQRQLEKNDLVIVDYDSDPTLMFVRDQVKKAFILGISKIKVGSLQ